MYGILGPYVLFSTLISYILEEGNCEEVDKLPTAWLDTDWLAPMNMTTLFYFAVADISVSEAYSPLCISM